MMYAVGTFTTISQGGTTYTRNNVFSFSVSAPYAVSSWNVDVNGSVNSIAFTNGHGCADAYLGGNFTSVHGTAAKNIAEVSTSTGAVVTGFAHSANGPVNTLFGFGPHLLVGGRFTQINGSGRYRYVSLSPSTGQDDGFINLHVAGWVTSTGTSAGIDNQQLSHTGNLMLAEGNFKSVGGQSRQQIVMLNLGGSTATVTGWTSSEFNQSCISKEAFYVRAAAWSPDDSTVYVADTGDHPLNWTKGSFPLTGLCDAAAAFPATQKSVSHNWIEYTGCDSYYSVAADDGAVYVGGHERWAQNPDGCNNGRARRDSRPWPAGAEPQQRNGGNLRWHAAVQLVQGKRGRHADHQRRPVDRQHQPIRLRRVRRRQRPRGHLLPAVRLTHSTSPRTRPGCIPVWSAGPGL